MKSLSCCLVVAALLTGPQSSASENAVCPDAGVDLVLRDHLYGEAPFNPSGNAFSVAVRVKPEVAVANGRRPRLVLSAGNGYNHGFRLCLRLDSEKGTYHPYLEFGKGGRPTAWTIDAPSGSVKPGCWHRIVATWDGCTARLYVEGREVAAAPYNGVYVRPARNCAKTGVPGEEYGILSIPHLLDRATVWTRCISQAEVAAYDPGAAFEPDTPEFVDFARRIKRGEKLSADEIRRAREGVHSEVVRFMLDKALALELLRKGDLDAARRLRDEVLANMRKAKGGDFAAVEFTERFREEALDMGFSTFVLEELKSEFLGLRASNAGHLPYAALRLMRFGEG